MMADSYKFPGEYVTFETVDRWFIERFRRVKKERPQMDAWFKVPECCPACKQDMLVGAVFGDDLYDHNCPGYVHRMPAGHICLSCEFSGLTEAWCDGIDAAGQSGLQ
ncbi:MAG: hypothetical protein ACPG7F_06150 [Aggregatilineales bacterium]